jgi:two-component system, chemotaxis family, CheB/CheR fusion protein
MDGYEVATRIRKEPHGRHMLPLALTGYSAADDVKQSTEAGFDYHLVKPVDADHLTRLVTHGVAAA